MDAPTKTRVERGEELELTVDSLAFGGAGVARRDGYVVFVRDADPRRPRARGGDQAQEGLRRGAHGRAARGRARAHRRRSPTIRARRGRCCPTSASSRSRPSRSTTRCARIGQLDGYELEPIVPAVEQWRYRNKLEYSFGTADDGALVCGFHAPGSWERIEHVEDCLLASEAGNEARRAALAWCREHGLARLRPPRADRPAAQPRRARGPAHRRAAGPPRHLRRARSTSTASPRRSAPAASCGRARWTSARRPRAA